MKYFINISERNQEKKTYFCDFSFAINVNKRVSKTFSDQIGRFLKIFGFQETKSGFLERKFFFFF